MTPCGNRLGCYNVYTHDTGQGNNTFWIEVEVRGRGKGEGRWREGEGEERE